MNGKMQDVRLPFADVLVNIPLFEADEGVEGRSHLKGKIINHEWKELRSNTLYSRGDKTKKRKVLCSYYL
ncbi:hypothetical protein [Niallia endozanthoxylica]|uniref:hypothetical protein n=1 Tax=Niallia endozanthoxylica TaxID=2036016 RepID=UPI001CC3CA3F|nr:hypothetical protein [Niallia endozanthoxylica]